MTMTLTARQAGPGHLSATGEVREEGCTPDVAYACKIKYSALSHLPLCELPVDLGGDEDSHTRRDGGGEQEESIPVSWADSFECELERACMTSIPAAPTLPGLCIRDEDDDDVVVAKGSWRRQGDDGGDSPAAVATATSQRVTRGE